MERITRVRVGIVLAIFMLILGFFALKLYDMQIIETGGVVDNVKYYTTETRVKAARGEITDCNGNILVSNRASYDLVFNHYVICSAPERNQRLMELVKLCRAESSCFPEDLSSVCAGSRLGEMFPKALGGG